MPQRDPGVYLEYIEHYAHVGRRRIKLRDCLDNLFVFGIYLSPALPV
jgi:hypothetical protein